MNKYNDIKSEIEKELHINGVMVVITGFRNNSKAEANLIGFKPFGEELWRLTPPMDDGNDSFVNFWIENDQFWAGSWSGFKLRINTNTGEVLERVFTK